MRAGGLVLDQARRRAAGRRAADLGESGAQAAHGHDAAGRRAAAGPRDARSASPPPSRTALDRAAAAAPNPGAPVLHRLNRTEYANAVRDLLDLPVDAAALLPGDDSSEGFDNIASVLSVSPALMQAYVSAAAKISRLAVGDPTISSGITTYAAPRGLSQAEHREGLPLGTRGGLLVRARVPARRRVRVPNRPVGRRAFGLPAVGGDEPVEITLTASGVRLLGRDAPRDRSASRSRPARTRRRRHRPQGERARRRRSVLRAGRPAPACTNLVDQRPAQSDRARRHAEPAQDLRLPPADARLEEAGRARGGS